ncbi:MAG: hypothetical protein C0605_13675 [Hyphomicrobiales bacterium]|nr:MAG: hypothetical protein C0605_13675 [Hyphomicrobiales bacterium]
MSRLTGWLKKRPKQRALTMALEAAAALVLVLALGLLVLGWRISHSPMSVMMFQSRIADTLNAELGNATVRFSDAVVMWDDDGVQFRLVDLRLIGTDGKLIAGAPNAAVSLAMSALLMGEFQVSQLTLVQPVITLSRSRSGIFRLGFGDLSGQGAIPAPAKTAPPAGQSAAPPPAAAGSAPVPLWRALFADRKLDLLELVGIGPESSLTHIGIRDAALALIDETSGRVWQAHDVRLAFSRTARTDTFFGSASFEVDKARSHLTVTASANRRTRNVSVLSRFRDLDPSDFAPLLSELMLGSANLPLSGNAALSISGDGRLLGASVDIEAGAGLIGLPGPGGRTLLVDEAGLTMQYDGRADRLKISSLSVSSGANLFAFEGGVIPERDQDGNITGFSFDLSSDRMALALGGETEGMRKPLRIGRATARGQIDLAPFHLRLDQLALKAGKLALSLKGDITDAEISPQLRLQGFGRAIPVADLKRLWPRTILSGTREWIGENITGGLVDKLGFKVNLEPGDIALAEKGIPLPDNAVRLDFDLSGVAFHYIRGLPQITDAAGHGHMDGDKFTIDVDRARIKSPSGLMVRVTSGQFLIPETHKDISRGYADGRITVDLAGETRGILEILDMEPLGYVRKMNLKPADVGGSASGQLRISLPLIRDLDLDQVRIDAEARLQKTRIDKVVPGLDLSDGSARMHITNDGLTARGDVRLNGVAADLVWTESFTDSKRPSSRFELTGTLDDANRNALGVDLSDFLTGRTAVKLVATGRRGGISEARVRADLTGAVLKSDEIVWKKPAGRAAKATFDLYFKDGGLIQLRKLVVRGKGVNLKGGLDFTDNGDLMSLDLKTVRLGAHTSLSLAGKRSRDGVLDLKLSGSSFDARPLLTDLFSTGPAPAGGSSGGGSSAGGGTGGGGTGGASGGGRHVRLQGGMDVILGHHGVRLSEARLTLESIGDTLEAMSLVGRFGKSDDFRMKIARRNTRLRQITLSGGDSGAILKGADFYTRVKGGSFTLNAEMIEGGKGPDMTGTVRMAKFRIVNEPALNSLLSSAKQKNAKPVSGKNVPFDKIRVQFSRRAGVLKFSKGLIAGPSIGATARGELDNRNNTLLVSGTLVPAYGLNAALGKIPVLGMFLSGRKGEGLIGITFGIKGPREKPLITVNPISALAPGFLRMLFEFRGEDKPAPKAAPSGGKLEK